jgi:quercetin dioxygenase-like cupin family protein
MEANLGELIVTSMVNCESIPWVELMPGFEIRLLRVGEGSGTYSVMTRLAPGIQVPRHHHHGDVHAWTISGRWRYKEYDWVAGPGDYVYEPKDSVHTLQIPEDSNEPAVALFVISGSQDYLDDAGNVLWSQTAEMVEQLYRNVLAQQGLEYPEAILP